MATAKSTVVQPPPETIITLELNEQEAKVLLLLTGSILGCAKNSNRKHTNAIYSALRPMISDTLRVSEQFVSGKNILHFKEYPNEPK